MQILVVGAGAIGGYFGGRLLEAGRDVTFLVRRRRAAQLAKTGLIIRSPRGDATLPAPPTVVADALREPFDVILLSLKAYDLKDTAETFAPAVGADTAILPLLNGMAHMESLSARFGARKVLGGQCQISTTLDVEGRILHLSDFHNMSFGETDGSISQRAEAIVAQLAGARFESRLSKTILQEMWDKWLLIATMAGITCLMRAAVGDIMAADGGNLTTALLGECAAVATAHGFAPSQSHLGFAAAMLTKPGSALTASMLRDMERGAPIEADHIIGDLVRRAEAKGVDCPLLRIAHVHLKAYEARRTREAAVARAA